MIVLDTNVISELMRTKGDKSVKQWVASQSKTLLYTTSIAQAEILYGIAILPDGKKRFQLLERADLMFSIDFAERILNFDSTAASCYAKIVAQRRKLGTPISQFDAQIAAICLSHQATIATRNIDDFVNCQITIVNPWQTSFY